MPAHKGQFDDLILDESSPEFRQTRHYSHRFVRDGLYLPVQLGIPTTHLHLPSYEGHPTSMSGYALLDLGSSSSAVDERMARDGLALPQTGAVAVESAGGTNLHTRFLARLTFPSLNWDIPVVELNGIPLGGPVNRKADEAAVGYVYVLVGRDLLQHCRIEVDVKAGYWSIERK